MSQSLLRLTMSVLLAFGIGSVACNESSGGTSDTESDSSVTSDADSDTNSENDSTTSSASGTQGNDDSERDSDSGSESGDCRSLGDGDYGVCEMVLGYAYDGTRCSLFSGCGCAPDCDQFFETEAACNAMCKESNPGCDTTLFSRLMGEPLDVGTFCDDVILCVESEQIGAFEAAFENIDCRTSSASCETESGRQCFTQIPSEGYFVSQTDYTQLCAASVQPGILSVDCMVWLK